jgi:hypothetical protein
MPLSDPRSYLRKIFSVGLEARAVMYFILDMIAKVDADRKLLGVHSFPWSHSHLLTT